MYINQIYSNIYIYLTMVYLYNHARVQPELACPKLDLVLHHMLQAFRPQMPGTHQNPGQLAFLGSPLCGPWKWSRWRILSKEIKWKKNNPLICCFWIPTISAPAPTAIPTKRPGLSLDLQNDQTQCTQTLNIPKSSQDLLRIWNL